MRRLAVIVMGLMATLVWVTAQENARGQGTSVSWQPADPGRQLSLPRDHAAHPEAKIEWWYYTGHLFTTSGRRFGYQLTFFRFGVDPRPANPSRWAVRDLYMAHFAVSDVAGRTHHHRELLNRAGPGWAGASAVGYQVWNEGWSVTLEPDGRHRLVAKDAGIALDLRLQEGKPVVLHGEQGYSRKGPTPGNASHYYSLTRMPTTGALWLDGTRHEVQGDSWMDHEFGSSFLEQGQLGWDWFSLQLEDGSELMLFRIRNAQATAESASGTLVDPQGVARPLGGSEFSLVPARRWQSPESGARYPVSWQVRVPAASLDLRVRAVFEAQELKGGGASGITYWEGAVDVEGTRSGRGVRGRGYLEMTGYTGRPMSDVLR